MLVLTTLAKYALGFNRMCKARSANGRRHCHGTMTLDVSKEKQ